MRTDYGTLWFTVPGSKRRRSLDILKGEMGEPSESSLLVLLLITL